MHKWLIVLAVVGCSPAPTPNPNPMCKTAGCDPVAACTEGGGVVTCKCPAQYYDLNGDGKTCHACTATCGTDQYQTAACSDNADTQCKSCSTCGAQKYLKSACTKSADTVCAACSACSGTEYAATACSAAADTVCATCTTCTSSQFQTAACSASADTACSSCTTCSSTQYQTAACAADSDATCADCTTCSGNHHETTACSGSTDRVCGDCATACGAGQYESTACTATSDRACTACDAGCVTCSGAGANACTSCAAGKYLSGSTCVACTAVSHCNSAVTCTTANDSQCTSCASTFYLVEGAADTCPACSVCGAGKYVAQACGPTANTVCGNCAAHCSACTSATACTTCDANYFLENSYCILPYGTGTTGNASLSGTFAPAHSYCSTNLDGTLFFHTDMALAAGQTLFIHASTGDYTGYWERNVITNGATHPTFTLQHPTRVPYNHAQCFVLDDYANVDVGALTAAAWNDNWGFKFGNIPVGSGSGGGIIAIQASGTVTLNGIVDMKGAGFRAYPPYDYDPNALPTIVSDVPGECYFGSDVGHAVGYDPQIGSLPTYSNYGGGGGGYWLNDNNCNPYMHGAGGGGGGHKTAGNYGAPECLDSPGGGAGQAYGEAIWSPTAPQERLVFGSGGGAGGYTGNTSSPAGRGGVGGGLIVVFAKQVVFGGGGGLDVRATAGGNEWSGGAGGGGGGSGGTILVLTPSPSPSPGFESAIQVQGGAGGTGIRGGGNGADGVSIILVGP